MPFFIECLLWFFNTKDTSTIKKIPLSFHYVVLYDDEKSVILPSREKYEEYRNKIGKPPKYCKKFENRKDAEAFLHRYLDTLKLPEATTLNSGGLNVDSEGYIHVYTDGSCKNNGGFNAAAGIGVFFAYDAHTFNVSELVKGKKITNQVAEIQAAIKAIEIAWQQKIKKLKIFTDSSHVLDAIRLGWIEKWKENGWKTTKKQIVKNKKDLQKLDKLIENNVIDVKWRYVKAHSKHHGNEEADKLAKKPINAVPVLQINVSKFRDKITQLEEGQWEKMIDSVISFTSEKLDTALEMNKIKQRNLNIELGVEFSEEVSSERRCVYL